MEQQSRRSRRRRERSRKIWEQSWKIWEQSRKLREQSRKMREQSRKIREQSRKIQETHVEMLSRNFHGSFEIVVLPCRNFHERQKVLMSVLGNCGAQRRKIHVGRIGKIHDEKMLGYDEKFLN